MSRLLISILVFSAVLICGRPDHVFADGFPVSVMESTLSVLPQRANGASDESRPEEPEGTGIALFDGSYIATAAHVLIGAESISVRLNDGRILPAQIVGQDGFTDIALLKIGLSIPPFVMADATTVGNPVCTVGNQFGLGLSVTCGVISAVHQSIVGFNPIEDFIQTDAAVNPGASGGALVDDAGQLIGMLSGIFTKDSDANIGVNFAVHAALLARVVQDLKDHGRVRRAKSGMVVQALTLDERQTQTGVRVVRVNTDSAAWRSGLRPDDVIVTMARRKVHYPKEVSAIVYAHRPGDAIAVDLSRNHESHHITLTLDQ